MPSSFLKSKKKNKPPLTYYIVVKVTRPKIPGEKNSFF